MAQSKQIPKPPSFSTTKAVESTQKSLPPTSESEESTSEKPSRQEH